MVPLGQKSETSAVPPKLAIKSPARRRAITRLSLVTGEKPVGAYWGKEFPVRPALCGPFHRFFSAAIPPPAAL